MGVILGDLQQVIVSDQICWKKNPLENRNNKLLGFVRACLCVRVRSHRVMELKAGSAITRNVGGRTTPMSECFYTSSPLPQSVSIEIIFNF